MFQKEQAKPSDCLWGAPAVRGEPRPSRLQAPPGMVPRPCQWRVETGPRGPRAPPPGFVHQSRALPTTWPSWDLRETLVHHRSSYKLLGPRRQWEEQSGGTWCKKQAQATGLHDPGVMGGRQGRAGVRVTLCFLKDTFLKQNNQVQGPEDVGNGRNIKRESRANVKKDHSGSHVHSTKHRKGQSR